MGVAPKRRRSLARKYTVFTVMLLVWAAVVQIGFRIRHDLWGGGSLGRIDWWELTVMALGAPIVGALISRFTNRLLAKPLAQLEEGIDRVREGNLEPIQVSRTGDEIEYLGDSLNTMIAAIAESRREVTEHQDLLEERIRQRTEALEEATGRALAASKAKSEFLANVSHELRTPMNGVLGMMDIVLDGELHPAQREQIETAKNCAQTLLALLNDLLDLSKIEAGRMLLESIPFQVREVVEGCVLALGPKALEKGIEVRTTIAPGVPMTLVGDPLRVRQILMNLMSNAVKFTSKGSVEVELSTGKQTEGQLVLHLRVRDTGPGIPAEKLAAIFDEFTQVDGSVSRQFGGTGLGLAITQRLVELHEGSIRVESEVGKGSCFLVDLVLGHAVPATSRRVLAPTADEIREANPAQDNSERDQQSPALILVVEDNAVNQKVVNAVLRKHGFRVEWAVNGAEAIKALEARDYDLILMDIQMPVMDGLAAARHIRSQPRWKDVPIVAMTAHAMRGDRERCLEAGMDDYMAKPVSPVHLVDTVRANLRRAPKTAPRAVRAIDQVPAVSAPPLRVPLAAPESIAPERMTPEARFPEASVPLEAPVPLETPVEASVAGSPTVPEQRMAAAPESSGPSADLAAPAAGDIVGANAPEEFEAEPEQAPEPLPAAPAAPAITVPQDSELPPPPSPPIDAEEAARLMGGDEHLRTGLTLLFLQLAPERLAKLHSAALRGDLLTVRAQALKIQAAAERIAALEIGRHAARIATIAPDADTTQIAEELALLESAVIHLDEYMRPEREAFEEAANHVLR
ncbi:MAG: response regulator [Bryobacteraceae bacterium]